MKRVRKEKGVTFGAVLEGVVATARPLAAWVGHALADRTFRLLVYTPLLPSQVLLDKPVSSLSGGELQRVAIVICLGSPARIYLMDEPAAGLDCEQRLAVAKAVRRWVNRGTDYGQTVLVIEHDLLMLSSMAERVVLFTGEPSVNCHASAPGSVTRGLNDLLGSQLKVTMRRDEQSGRPRINKKNSAKDREQRESGQYFDWAGS